MTGRRPRPGGTSATSPGPLRFAVPAKRPWPCGPRARHPARPGRWPGRPRGWPELPWPPRRYLRRSRESVRKRTRAWRSARRCRGRQRSRAATRRRPAPASRDLAPSGLRRRTETSPGWRPFGVPRRSARSSPAPITSWLLLAPTSLRVTTCGLAAALRSGRDVSLVTPLGSIWPAHQAAWEDGWAARRLQGWTVSSPMESRSLAMDALLAVPEPRNETVRDYAPAQRTGHQPAEAARRPRGIAPRPDDDHRRRAADGRRRAITWCSRTGTRTCSGSRTRDHADAEAAVAAAKDGRADVASDVVRGPGGRLPARRRPARRPVARHAQRRDHARPVEDRLPGRDRLGLRADRLPAVQRALRRAAARRAADLVARACGTGSTTGRSRASSTRSRRSTSPRSPATCPRRPALHGQHGGLEAVADAAVRRALHHAAVRGGRPAARRDQHGHRRRPRGQRRRARRPGPGRHPLHRLDQGVPAPVADGRARTSPRYRGYPRLVGETGGKDFVDRPPVRRRRRAAHGADPGRLRVPGPEVLGRVARVHPALDLGRRPARPAGRHRRRA